MADNSQQSGADTIRDIDRGPSKTQVVQLDHGGAAGESLTNLNNSLPVRITDLTEVDLLASVLIELRVISTLLQVGLSIKDDPAELRDDYSRAFN